MTSLGVIGTCEFGGFDSQLVTEWHFRSLAYLLEPVFLLYTLAVVLAHRDIFELAVAVVKTGMILGAAAPLAPLAWVILEVKNGVVVSAVAKEP